MKIDQNPFPTNTVEVKDKETPKVLTSESARKNKTVDPKVQVSVADIKSKSPQEEAECSRAPHKVTSQMLLNKFQRQHERARHQEEMMHRHEDHWGCPFVRYCWEEGVRLPSADNCPECNGPYRDS